MSWKREKEEISLQTITTYWSIAQPRYRKSSIQRVTREEGIFVEIAGVNVSVRGVGIDLSVPPPCKLLRNDWKTVSFQGEIFDLNGLLHPGERNVRTKRPVVTLLPRIDAPFKFHVLLSPLPIIKIGIRVFSQEEAEPAAFLPSAATGDSFNRDPARCVSSTTRSSLERDATRCFRKGNEI